jgi:CheY-like chemotaxis protein
MKEKPIILVVDDQPQNVELLEAYLVPQGYEVVMAARSGRKLKWGREQHSSSLFPSEEDDYGDEKQDYND